VPSRSIPVPIGIRRPGHGSMSRSRARWRRGGARCSGLGSPGTACAGSGCRHTATRETAQRTGAARPLDGCRLADRTGDNVATYRHPGSMTYNPGFPGDEAGPQPRYRPGAAAVPPGPPPLHPRGGRHQRQFAEPVPITEPFPVPRRRWRAVLSRSSSSEGWAVRGRSHPRSSGRGSWPRCTTARVRAPGLRAACPGSPRRRQA
jgi:hypothetical protein